MPTTMSRLLAGPLGSALDVRVLPPSPRELDQVTFLEDFGFTDALRPGAVVVLSRASERPTGDYQLDVLVRQCVDSDVAALVMRRTSRRSQTAETLALRGGLTLLDVRDDADPLQVLDWLVAAVSGDPRTALVQLAAAASWTPGQDDDAAAIVAELSRLSGVGLMLSNNTDGAPIEVDGRVRGSVVALEPGDAAIAAGQIAAATLSLTLSARQREIIEPLRSTSSALGQLLLCSQANLAAVSERALDVGLQVYGWHCAARLAVDDEDGNSDDRELAAIEDDTIDLIARSVRDPRASWTVARPDTSLVLVRTTMTPPRTGAGNPMQDTIGSLIADLVSRHPLMRFRAGIATSHEGPSGLRTSAEEARAALASARLSDLHLSIATFDSLGLRRMLAEWLATDAARDTVSSLLAPLDALGPEKSAAAIATLHAYLDERGSLKRAAARLNLHRNAVVYRMSQISQTLALDLDDPDQRFALQLACRGRLMTEGRT